MKPLSLVIVMEGGYVQSVLSNKVAKLDIVVLDHGTEGSDPETVNCISPQNPKDKEHALAIQYLPDIQCKPKRVKQLQKNAKDPVTLREVLAVSDTLGRPLDLSNDFIAFVRKARKLNKNDIATSDPSLFKAALERTLSRMEAPLAERIDLYKAALALNALS
jgi:hypothetical protein